jgi:hypothetical protein
MLEVLAGGLHGVDHVGGGKCFAMAACHADQQSLD